MLILALLAFAGWAAFEALATACRPRRRAPLLQARAEYAARHRAIPGGVS